jgi:hypothetical protein
MNPAHISGGEHMGESPHSLWAHLRGLLVALHLAAVTLLALPALGEGLNRWAWQDPTVQEEFADWTCRLNRWGVHVTQQQFEDDLYDVGLAYESARARALAPFGRYYEYCGTFQSWRMFAGPHRYPSRLHIEVEEAGDWQSVYVKSDPDHTWLSDRLDHYRMRPFLYRLSWYRYAEFGDFNDLARWVARQAARDFPGAGRVSVSLHMSRTPSPDEVNAGQPIKGECVSKVVLDLGAWR